MFMSGKQNTRKPRFFQKHWWKLAIALLFVGSLAFLGYNKYLDQQNVNNMKQILAEFEKLKSTVEAETSEKLYIEATCGSVGSFANSYSCDVLLKPKNNTKTSEIIKSIKDNTPGYLVGYGCILASEGYRLENSSSDYYICSGIKINSANIDKAEEIFFKYDTSPGSNI